MRVALVHDWLVGMRGAERCLECLCDMFPQADIYTLFHAKGTVSSKIEAHHISVSFVNSFPSVQNYYRYLLPVMPFAVEAFRFDDYDLVISSSSCVAKGIVVPPGARHVSYVYSPMRYAWDLSTLYFGTPGGQSDFYHAVVSAFLHPLRVWDASSWIRPDKIAVVSKYISKRLKKVCQRKSMVIYPPVNTHFFSKGLNENKQDFFLLVTAFEPNRQPETAIEACIRANMRLKVVGSLGRYGERCRTKANENIEFLGTVSDKKLCALYGQALGLIVPGIEDFGMAAVEAMAAGTPVIVSSEGGAKEILENRSAEAGYVFQNNKVDSLCHAITQIRHGWEHNVWKRSEIATLASAFSVKRFHDKFMDFIQDNNI